MLKLLAKMVYKWCVVPQCINTSIKNPNKLFLSVPTNPKRRKMWLKLARRDPNSILSHTNVFMCEDHFDMRKDTINYLKYKMGFSKKILLADDAVPTKFNRQEDRKRRLSDAGPPREGFLKRQRTPGTPVPQIGNANARKIDKLGLKTKRNIQQYKSPILQTQSSDDIIDDIVFDKCKLSLKSSTSPSTDGIENRVFNDDNIKHTYRISDDTVKTETQVNNDVNTAITVPTAHVLETDYSDTERRNSVVTPDVVRCLDNYTEDELVAHKVKLEELQLKQKLMEEQNKKRKEMLAKALADRTKQTEEEVQKLEKIKKELQVLDGQFSLDVAVLRKKIDQACLSYSEAEKHYLKVEKDFLQAKINLQKEKEKKELLTEHLCALITHNETRKAQKLETLMLELANDKSNIINNANSTTPTEDKSIIIDGVDVTTGKMVELTPTS